MAMHIATRADRKQDRADRLRIRSTDVQECWFCNETLKGNGQCPECDFR